MLLKLSGVSISMRDYPGFHVFITQLCLTKKKKRLLWLEFWRERGQLAGEQFFKSLLSDSLNSCVGEQRMHPCVCGDCKPRNQQSDCHVFIQVSFGKCCNSCLFGCWRSYPGFGFHTWKIICSTIKLPAGWMVFVFLTSFVCYLCKMVHNIADGCAFIVKSYCTIAATEVSIAFYDCSLDLSGPSSLHPLLAPCQPQFCCQSSSVCFHWTLFPLLYSFILSYKWDYLAFVFFHLISLNMTPIGSIHIIKKGRISSFLLALYVVKIVGYVPTYITPMYTYSLFINSSVIRYQSFQDLGYYKIMLP